jgi:hypothetical protein
MTELIQFWVPFKEAIMEHFAFLARQYGFHWSSEDMSDGREMYVSFDNETTRVTVHVEQGSAPWVTVGRIESRPSGMIETEGWDIGFIRMLRSGGPERSKPAGRFTTRDESLRMLQEEADSLFYCAHDVLIGNFSVFERVRPVAEEAKRKAEAKLYGTS